MPPHSTASLAKKSRQKKDRVSIDLKLFDADALRDESGLDGALKALSSCVHNGGTQMALEALLSRPGLFEFVYSGERSQQRICTPSSD